MSHSTFSFLSCLYHSYHPFLPLLHHSWRSFLDPLSTFFFALILLFPPLSPHFPYLPSVEHLSPVFTGVHISSSSHLTEMYRSALSSDKNVFFPLCIKSQSQMESERKMKNGWWWENNANYKEIKMILLNERRDEKTRKWWITDSRKQRTAECNRLGNACVINKDRDRGIVNNDPVPEIEGEENQGN